jgi:pimeloyl-ACP methyl ester carboxylesterase
VAHDSVADRRGSVVSHEVTWRWVRSGLIRELWFRPGSPRGADTAHAAPSSASSASLVPEPPANVAVAGMSTTVVVFPGLGLPRYLLPLARALAGGGAQCVVFDALAFRRRGRRVAPTIEGLAAAGAEWLKELDLPGPVTVLGHSTGSQVALEVVLALQDERPDLQLVMGGPTFNPAQRRWRRLVPAALTAYRKDTPKELVVVQNLLRVRTDVGRIVLSGLRHRPEERVELLRVPLRLTAGEADSFAPARWLHELATRSGASAEVRVLPGSHNNVFIHEDAFIDVVMSHRA